MTFTSTQAVNNNVLTEETELTDLLIHNKSLNHTYCSIMYYTTPTIVISSGAMVDTASTAETTNHHHIFTFLYKPKSVFLCLTLFACH